MPVALFALAVGTFGIGLTEFAIIGLLPEVARDLAVSEAAAGWLVSGYAITVAVGAVLVTMAVVRFDRKHVLTGLLGLFVLGNALCALAPDYPWMLAGRIVAALCHGAFFGIGSLVAVGLAGPGRESRAVAVILTGLTTANVLGVPAGTLLGQHLGWRATFWAIVAVGVVALVAVLTTVPRVPGSDHGLIAEARGLVEGPVLVSLLSTTLVFAAIFGAFTYIAYTLTSVSGFTAGTVPWLLVAFGVGQFTGTLLGGREADRSVARGLLITVGGLTAVLALFAATASFQIAGVVWLVLLGATGFGAVPALQTRVIGVAANAPGLASSANISAINVGISVGAWVSGLALSAGLGYTSPLWIGALFGAVALLVIAGSLRGAGRPPAEATV